MMITIEGTSPKLHRKELSASPTLEANIVTWEDNYQQELINSKPHLDRLYSPVFSI